MTPPRLIFRHIAEHIPSSYFDLEFTLLPSPAAAAAAAQQGSTTACAAGIMLPAWAASSIHSTSSDTHSAGITAAGQGAVLLYDFVTCTLCLTVGPGVGAELLCQGDSGSNPSSAAVEAAAGRPELAAAELLASYFPAGSSDVSRKWPATVRQLGGQLRLAAFEPLKLRLLMDFSLLEVFCGDGQVLSTRVYRGVWTAGRDSSLLAESASTAVQAVSGHAGMPLQQDGPAGDSSVTTEALASPIGEHSSIRDVCEVNADGLGMHGPAGVHLLAVGSDAVAADVCMHAMGSAWVES